jgi:prevent-host-death family protein
MAASANSGNSMVVSALHARANFGKLLNQVEGGVEGESRSLVIEKRGTPRAVLLSLRDYVKLAAPEPEILRLIGEESERKGTSKLTARQIDRAIKAARAQKKKRSC